MHIRISKRLRPLVLWKRKNNHVCYTLAYSVYQADKLKAAYYDDLWVNGPDITFVITLVI